MTNIQSSSPTIPSSTLPAIWAEQKGDETLILTGYNSETLQAILYKILAPQSQFGKPDLKKGSLGGWRISVQVNKSIASAWIKRAEELRMTLPLAQSPRELPEEDLAFIRLKVPQDRYLECLSHLKGQSWLEMNILSDMVNGEVLVILGQGNIYRLSLGLASFRPEMKRLYWEDLPSDFSIWPKEPAGEESSSNPTPEPEVMPPAEEEVEAEIEPSDPPVDLYQVPLKVLKAKALEFQSQVQSHLHDGEFLALQKKAKKYAYFNLFLAHEFPTQEIADLIKAHS